MFITRALLRLICLWNLLMGKPIKEDEYDREAKIILIQARARHRRSVNTLQKTVRGVLAQLDTEGLQDGTASERGH